MSPSEVFAAGMIVMAGVRWVRRRQWGPRWKLRLAKRASLGELPEGKVARIVGTARSAGATLEAPLSGRTCLAYFVQVEGLERAQKGRDAWKGIIKVLGGVPFAIDDGTGRALVDPQDAEITLELDAAAEVGETNARAVAFFHRQGKVIPRGRLRYREGVIEEGERVAVLGAGVREPDPDAAPTSYRGEQPTRLVVASSPKHRVVISDRPDTTR